MASTSTTCAPERAAELAESLNSVRARVTAASRDRSPTLVAVSKLKPASDVQGCYQHGQRDFGENYVQELCDKAPVLPEDIRWHFIGTLQSNKAKTLASIPNLYAVHTLNSTKAATALNKGVPDTRATPLNVLIQVNTSGEDSKSGLPPLTTTSSSELVDLARHVVTDCPKLHLLGLMTIGSLDASLNEGDENKDFETLTRTRDLLQEALRGSGADGGRWGEDGKLLLSMGMSSDFEAAIHAGSAIVRVGTSIFGSRK
ncbi:hypothetical protein EXIGLDRAFT_736451 [Exidia glandulosa HHB12029]|uniref:Pyridoxal phosphate homeostasis protein n=1 Tax=Exidia glandulosa HHB12029 TaxID=1314781 RepID=A0A165JDW4_EXIGL|nr:hypothetical protein EXIGLDRAFT_736451 [Exidia glandulosa HHB12029]